MFQTFRQGDLRLDDPGATRVVTGSNVANEVTIYAGARHGYTMPDLPVYDEGAAERHWTEMLALFDETLKEKVAA